MRATPSPGAFVRWVAVAGRESAARLPKGYRQQANGWTVVDMKAIWRKIFPAAKK